MHYRQMLHFGWNKVWLQPSTSRNDDLKITAVAVAAAATAITTSAPTAAKTITKESRKHNNCGNDKQQREDSNNACLLKDIPHKLESSESTSSGTEYTSKVVPLV